MYPVIITAIAFFLSIIVPIYPCLATEPIVTAPSAILYDRVAQEILFDKESRKPRPPASTTKIMTAIITIEMGCMGEEVTVSKYAASIGGTSIHLQEGEILTVEDLLWGALLNSGNDSCVALAEAVAGSEALFVEMMNKKAVLMGAFDTTFKNTNGLPKDGHSSTAYDLLIMANYALDNPVFANIVSTKQAVIPKQSNARPRNLSNTNKLLSSYQGADGVKTGTTNAAGQCLVSSATRNNRQLISVVLKSGNRWEDSVKVLNHGFEDYCLYQIPKGTEVGTLYYDKAKPYQVRLITQEDACFTVAKGKLQDYEKHLSVTKPGLPLKSGEKVGYLEIKANKEYRIPVTVGTFVKKETVVHAIRKIFCSINEDFKLSGLMMPKED